ncbi:E3 ubiquitin-protein ligase hrd1 [Gnomoniopsis smithogilvyi]|uniref:RING-type E3 ubiquitin transferase n=1 Tax=Gnomoniopsis smithogilvyi TaxID=1191159 RepID=A0A9W8YSP5_9PEZI|nr:E3 ubiquitin-protein ligase hrd1 [Gnomoniopsis smithogilvyi]
MTKFINWNVASDAANRTAPHPTMRLAMYAGASAALAASVVTSAFYQRANFYSAMVYLSQSNLCLMILVNLIFLVYGSFMYGLQRLCFGALRPVEVEQLYEKAWFAVTETCLAMTVFREEVGAFFLVMFTALITGKVWGWIGEGRVEVFEQQPPANPRLFHTRLVISLVTSVVFNTWLLAYSIDTVIATAKPTMMVMFLFEFAVLTVGSLHTALRYVISLVEASVIKKQTKQRLEQRRNEVRQEREDILRRRAAGEPTAGEGEPLPDPEEVEEFDIEVPGWDSKGQWILFLDLFADFLKLSVYTAFFCVLLVFYGLPIHIMRDLFMTTRSFVKRLSALMKYKQALRDMNRYPDATADDLGREDTCIICREEMRPWDPNAGQLERHRPKKLPCGHILHFGCLKSWLERQQVCPTCRSSVVADQQPRNANYQQRMAFHIAANNGQNQGGANGPAPGVQDAQLNGQAGPGGQQPPAPQGAMRYINLGPIRLGFAQGGQEVADLANRMGVDLNNAMPIPPQANNPAAPADLSTMEAVRNRLLEVDQRIQQEVRDIQQGIQSVQTAQQEVHLINAMLAELARIRQNQDQGQPHAPFPLDQPGQSTPAPAAANAAAGGGLPHLPHPPMGGPMVFPPHPHGGPLQFPLPPFALPGNFAHRMNPPVTRHGAAANATAIPAGSPDLPEGVVLPQGWSLLPLQRLDPAVATAAAPAPGGLGVQVNVHDLSHQSGGAPSQPSGTTETSSPHSNPQSTSIPNQNLTEPTEALAPVGPQVEVAAPTPLTPNWGGSAQLFGSSHGSNTSLPFGVQAGGSSRSVSESHKNLESSEAGSSSATKQPGVSGTTGPEEGEESSVSKGKAPAAATVEDAEDES